MVYESPTLESERELAAQGYELIVGFDEVGRGALAGPVMVGAAAVLACDLPELTVPAGVTHAYSTNLLEEIEEELPVENGQVAFTIKPYEIKTILLQ